MSINQIGSSYPFVTADYADHSVTYAKMQQAAAATLLSNPTGVLADVQETTLGAGLSFVGSTLVATGAVSNVTVSGTSQTAAVNTRYFTNNVSLCTVTLPTTAAVGDVVAIQGVGAGGWKLAQNASQLIHCSPGVTTTTGTGGDLHSVNQYDTVVVRCIVANTTWKLELVSNNVDYV